MQRSKNNTLFSSVRWCKNQFKSISFFYFCQPPHTKGFSKNKIYVIFFWSHVENTILIGAESTQVRNERPSVECGTTTTTTTATTMSEETLFSAADLLENNNSILSRNNELKDYRQDWNVITSIAGGPSRTFDKSTIVKKWQNWGLFVSPLAQWLKGLRCSNLKSKVSVANSIVS